MLLTFKVNGNERVRNGSRLHIEKGRVLSRGASLLLERQMRFELTTFSLGSPENRFILSYAVLFHACCTHFWYTRADYVLARPVSTAHATAHGLDLDKNVRGGISAV